MQHIVQWIAEFPSGKVKKKSLIAAILNGLQVWKHNLHTSVLKEKICIIKMRKKFLFWQCKLKCVICLLYVMYNSYSTSERYVILDIRDRGLFKPLPFLSPYRSVSACCKYLSLEVRLCCLSSWAWLQCLRLPARVVRARMPPELASSGYTSSLQITRQRH
jgi:hypothetical protein